MTIMRRLARPLLAAAFVDQGVQLARKAPERAAAWSPVVERVREPLSLGDRDVATVVRVDGAAMAVSGLLFGLGRLPRASALVMAVSMAPSTVAEHAFWKVQGEERKAQRTLFLKDLGLVGAALVSVVDTEGRPGLGWRGKRAAKDASRASRGAAKLARREARHAAHTVDREARLAGHRVGSKVGV
ncbi:DoxX family protein [Pseudokineococcus marinus]|uniref:DoxX family protein n=1 Tax=Pseudokineococcus marinus TaxID=351215 RepID=A0A849BM59_9ACTN|nr:DoxX family protein [Pseudokineococcus marinus]NNH22137.1 DoxX family protein [Pseudokineococcus marinus]